MDGPTKEAINKFIASNGIPGVMPTMEMFEDAGMIALVHAINHCGGVMRACKVMVLISILIYDIDDSSSRWFISSTPRNSLLSPPELRGVQPTTTLAAPPVTQQPVFISRCRPVPLVHFNRHFNRHLNPVF